MVDGQNQSLIKSKLFVKLLQNSGIDVSEAYLFWSSVEGRLDNESDIDIAVVSKDFQGLPYEYIKKISKHRRKIDLRLEVHPFSLEKIATDPPQFYLHIKNIGIKIQ